MKESLAQVRIVAFDLDDTLWSIGPVIHRAETRLFEWLREHCPRIAERVTVEQMRAARERLARDEPHRAHDLTYLRIASMARHARECGYDESIAEQAYEVFFAARNEVELFRDVRPGLEQLREHYLLATFSNGNADLARIGLADLFAVSLNARQVGAAKPDPRCFSCLVEALGVAPEEVLYVGDNPILDVQAARAAGLRTAWMNRDDAIWPAGVERADLVVRDCLDLVRRLERGS